MKRLPFALLAPIAAVTVAVSIPGAVASPSPVASTVVVAPGVSGLTASAGGRANAATRAKVEGWVESLRPGLIPNLGQVAGAGRGAAPNVLYSAQVGDARIYVTTSGLSHYFLASRDEEEEGTPRRNADHDESIDWCRLDVELPGARIRPDRVRLEDPLLDQGVTNYYLPGAPEGVLNVPAYGKVTFLDVYSGIDWAVISQPGRGVHHDFIVHPGADAGQVRLEYKGAGSIELSDDARALRVRTPLGEVREGALACSQGDGRIPIGARFQVSGNTVSLALDPYDRGQPLVIDPPLQWSTYYGGSGYDGPLSITCDNVNDCVYVVGYTNSTNLPVLNAGGFFQGTAAGGDTDGFIWRFTQFGVRTWATYYGGSANERNTDCAVDGSGNLYVCGSTVSTDLPTLNMAGAYYQPGNAGSQDAYLLRFNPLGVRQWATYYGGSGEENATGLTTDAGGKVLMVGASQSSNLPLWNPGGGVYYQPAPLSPFDGYIARFDALGAQDWATYFGGAGGDDRPGGITTTATDIYLAGSTMSASFPTLDPGGGAYFQGTFAGVEDAFISRFSLAGVLSWSTYYGGGNYDYGDQPVVDGSGNLFVCGYTLSSDLPTFNPGGTAYFQGANAGDYDLFLAKFSGTNARLWATYYGGSWGETLTGGEGKPMTLDAQGGVYVTAMTSSPDLPVLNPGGGSFFQGTYGGTRDALVAQFGNDGTRLWSTYLGTAFMDFGTSASVGGQGCLFATGESWGAGFPVVNPGGAWYQPASAGSDDGFIARFCTPNSSCCLDNTCVPVSSQAQCTALGGQTFYPNQPCSTTVCSILCNICGTKYGDLNRNGVRDNGEPGLPGWTIQLRYPGGAVYATTATDALGNYCFNDIPCGPWTVSEEMQPGHVQTQPSPNVHALNLGIGSTLNGVDFGNYACVPAPDCAPPPPMQAAWWPFGELPGATTAGDIAHPSPARNVAQVHGGGGATVPGALCLASGSDYAVVPNSGQQGLNFAAGSFSMATWILPASGGAGSRMIVEKRLLISAAGGESRGWALSLDGLQAFLEIGTGATPQIVPGPVVTPDAWSHLAVVVDRPAGQGRWYLNGDPVATFDFVPITGLVSSNADLYMGQVSPPFGVSPGFQGCIGDVALFAAPVTEAALRKAYTQGPIGWCPEYALMPHVTTICKNRSMVQVCFNICNNNPTSQSYHWSLAGLPAGAGCTVAGPVTFSPAAGTVTVPPGGCSPAICVTITRPAGLTAQNATSCFALTFVNDATGVCRTRTATLRADNSCWCATPVPSGVVSVPGGAGVTIGIGIHHPCDPPATLAYKVRAAWLNADYDDPLAVSLDGRAPGIPATGQVTAGPGADAEVAVNVRYPGGYDPSAPYEIVLEADADGDGQMERLAGTVVVAAYEGAPPVGVSAGSPAGPGARLVASPTPFLGVSTIAFTLAREGQIELGVYDLGGRLIRSLHRGRLAAGVHRFEWNGREDSGRRAGPGVYFVRLDGAGGHLEAKVVKLQ